MRLTGGRVFDPEQGFTLRDLCTDGAYIAPDSGDDTVLDARGCWVIPGLVDLHFHGCVGEDFSDASPDGLQKIADFELSQGVAYLCPAAMTLPEERLIAVCQNAAAHRKRGAGGAELAGIHLEGPFLSPAKKGAQNEAYLRAPDPALLERLQAASGGCVRLVALAPELPGSFELIKAAGKLGITVSVGHTAAGYDTARAAFEAGAAQVTHLFNAMPPLAHREPGPIGAAFQLPHVRAELICDGVHIHPAAVRAAFRLFGRERMILVSDSMRAAGMPDGRYTLGDQTVIVKGSLCTLEDGATIAGSSTNLMSCMKIAVSFGIPLADAVRACTCNPAQAIGIDGRAGTLETGKEASIVLLNEKDLSVKAIVFKGQVV